MGEQTEGTHTASSHRRLCSSAQGPRFTIIPQSSVVGGEGGRVMCPGWRHEGLRNLGQRPSRCGPRKGISECVMGIVADSS